MDILIKVKFKEPVKVYDFCHLPPLSFTAKFIFCKTFSKTQSDFDIITLNYECTDHLCVDLSTYDYNIQSIEHVKPNEL